MVLQWDPSLELKTTTADTDRWTPEGYVVTYGILRSNIAVDNWMQSMPTKAANDVQHYCGVAQLTE